MQIFTYVVVATFVLAAAYMTVALPLAIHRNMRRGDAFRESLVARLRGMPFGRMLAVRGVDADRFVAGNRVVDLQAYVKTCRDCGAGERCATDLDRGEMSDDGAYCPNRGTVVAFAADREAA